MVRILIKLQGSMKEVAKVNTTVSFLLEVRAGIVSTVQVDLFRNIANMPRTDRTSSLLPPFCNTAYFVC